MGFQEIEAAQREPRRRKLPAKQEVLLTVLRVAKAMTRHHAWPSPRAWQVKHQRQLLPLKTDPVALFDHETLGRQRTVTVMIPRGMTLVLRRSRTRHVNPPDVGAQGGRPRGNHTAKKSQVLDPICIMASSNGRPFSLATISTTLTASHGSVTCP